MATTALNIELPDAPTADQIALVASLRALHKRLQLRQSWQAEEICILLEAAADAAIRGNNVEKAKEIFTEAQKIFEQGLNSVNRNWYVLFLLLGVCIVDSVVIMLYFFLQSYLYPYPQLNIAALVLLFTNVGSMMSVLTRLNLLDLKTELSRKFVIYSAVAKHFVAISFSLIICVVLANKLVTISILGDPISPAGFALAGFLCGFSERFANDLLKQLTPD